MRDKLEAAFTPVALAIEDESARHKGHAGVSEEGESHFRIRIVSPAFTGLSRLERQRKVYAVLADELKSRVHALSLTAIAPGEGG